MNDKKFPKGFTLLWYVIYFFALLLKPLSQEGSIHLINLLALKGLKVAKENYYSLPKPWFNILAIQYQNKGYT